MNGFRRAATTIVALFFPRALKPALLNALGHQVHRSARIGPVFIAGTRLTLGPKTSIGPLNLIACRRLLLREEAYLGNLNRLTGTFSVHLAPRAAIGNLNRLVRGRPVPGPPRPSHLRLGELTKITSGHYVDCSESIRWGAFGTLAGSGSQVWTHGFVHDERGPGRACVAGRIRVGDNVYIGSHSVISAGVTIGDSISVGAHSSVAGSLKEPGVYVPERLRHIPRSASERLAGQDLVDEQARFYWKSGGGDLLAKR